MKQVVTMKKTHIQFVVWHSLIANQKKPSFSTHCMFSGKCLQIIIWLEWAVHFCALESHQEMQYSGRETNSTHLYFPFAVLKCYKGVQELTVRVHYVGNLSSVWSWLGSSSILHCGKVWGPLPKSCTSRPPSRTLYLLPLLCSHSHCLVRTKDSAISSDHNGINFWVLR